MPGDTRDECIGVVKVPLAPEVREYVKAGMLDPSISGTMPAPPRTSADAVRTLRSAEEDIGSLRALITGSALPKAGRSVLYILPRVELAYMKLMEDVPDRDAESMRTLRLENAGDALLLHLRQLDGVIGQTVRGEMGTALGGQLQCLIALKEVEDDYLDLRKVLDKGKGGGAGR
ncbi:hypothetical protein TeGR_g14144 [Tetraparma gracilis]|uniref:Uncharacterized protein n=1 Tax=Tetraparma gracilis TaxID=2962635 RepID=A0ABQ6M6L8_9STRA|nr:hypothetical protein TeGR_g14144 [Tetraparma gracilis]